MSSLQAKILTNLRFEQELHILLACFLQENAQLVKFFANFEEKSKKRVRNARYLRSNAFFHSHKHSSFAKKDSKTKKGK